jgi:glycosyltransferase involved in cell wall biosynthesis
MKLLYIANIRLPTEKAHGLQIVQNCEAFADAGAQVTLWVARRVNTPELRAIRDVWAHYGVKQNFALRRLPCIDLLPLVPGRVDRVAQVIFLIQLWTFALVAAGRAIFAQADVIYSRDEAVLLLLSLIKPRRALAYEAHTRSHGRIGRALQKRVVRRVGQVFAVTGKLGEDLIGLGAQADCVHVAHDGIRRERFEGVPEQGAARRKIGWSADAFVVGYVGRLQTMAMDKGVATLVEALAKVGGCALALVGGPDETAVELRARWVELGQDEARFLYAGQVAPERVPLYLSAFDVCAMPFPWTTHFAYYASPIKLFEYMASRRALVASDLPSIAEVVTDGESALLVPPSDVDALAEAIRRLKDDAGLRARLAENAYALVMEKYTWEARAKHILCQIDGKKVNFASEVNND